MRSPDDLKRKTSDLKFSGPLAETELLSSGAADKSLVPSTTNSTSTGPQWESTDAPDKGRSSGQTVIVLMIVLGLCLIAYFNVPLVVPILKCLAPPLFGIFLLVGILLRMSFPLQKGAQPSAYQRFLIRTFVGVLCTIPIIIFNFVAIAQLGRTADSYFQQGEYDKALETYNVLDNVYSPANYYKENKGDCYYHLGQYQKAVDNYSVSIKEEPTAELLLERAKAFKAMGNRVSAQNDEAAAYKIQKDDTPTV